MKIDVAKSRVIGESVWVMGIDEYIIWGNTKYPLKYSNGGDFEVSKEVPVYIINEIKKILKGEFI